MKKLFALLLSLSLFVLALPTAFAADEQETIPPDVDLSGLRRLAIAEPLYTQAKDGPSMGEIKDMLYSSSRVTRLYVMSCDAVAASIKRDTDVDIRALNHRQGMKVYKMCIGKYVDAYVIPTVANSKRKVMFFDVYQAGNDALLYSYQLTADKKAEDSILTYQALTEQFYKKLDRAINRQQKKKAADAEKIARMEKERISDPAKYEQEMKRQEEKKLKAEEKARRTKEREEARIAKEKAKEQAKLDKENRKKLERAEREAREAAQ